MNWINDYLPPGPYVDHSGQQVVVVEVVTHTHSNRAMRQLPIQPFVVYRKLVEPKDLKHERYSMRLTEFKQLFNPL